MELAPFTTTPATKPQVAFHRQLQTELAPFTIRPATNPQVALHCRPQMELAPFTIHPAAKHQVALQRKLQTELAKTLVSLEVPLGPLGKRGAVRPRPELGTVAGDEGVHELVDHRRV